MNLDQSGERMHGGPDRWGVPLHDFSSNGNACGPCPPALAAIREADATNYPDPGYTDLRERLAVFHGVDAMRVVLAASASEFIFRITAWAAHTQAPHGASATVWLPPHAYGDYAHAAQACGLSVVADAGAAQLRWLCDPSSPLGDAQAAVAAPADAASAITVLDRAYEPLRLEGALATTEAQLQMLWQLWTPNKALGLTGVRGAYAIAPDGPEGRWVAIALEERCPSWPLGAHGVALLRAWCEAPVQQWLVESLATLRDWKARQVALCRGLGWTVLAGQANFFVCRHGLSITERLDHLRKHGIKLRDCASFGLPGHVRLSVQPPASQDALVRAWASTR